MDAPKCQNFPSCGKRHYGPCGSGATGARPGATQARARATKGASATTSGPKKKSKVAATSGAGSGHVLKVPRDAKPYVRQSEDDPTAIELLAELLARVESLEARLAEIESDALKYAKQRANQRELMRQRRLEKKG